MKVDLLTLTLPPAGLSKLLYPWPDPPIPLLLIGEGIVILIRPPD